MWIKRLRLKNIGPHADLQVDMKCGLVGVFGKNGAGKTTLFEAAYAACTGDFTRFAGVKSDCINSKAGSDEQAFVAATIVHGGKTIDIIRRLRGKPSNELIVDGKQFTHTEKIEEKLFELLGVTKRVLDLFCFKSQTRIYDVIDATEAERKKSLQVLCQTEVCEQIWNLLGNRLNDAKVGSAEIVDNSDDLLARIAQLRTCADELISSRTSLENRIMSAADVRKVQKLLYNITYKAQLTSKKERLLKRQVTVDNDTASRKEELREQKARLLKLEDFVQKQESNVTNAQNMLTQWAQYEKQKQRMSQLLADKANIENILKAVCPSYEGESEERLLEKKEEVDSAIASIERRLSNFAATGTDVCPTCGSDISALLDDMKQDEAQLPALRKRRRTLSAKLTDVREYKSALQAYERNMEIQRNKLEDVCSALRDLSETGIQGPKGDREQLTALITKYKSTVNELTELKSSIARLSHQIEINEGQAQNIESKLKFVRKKIKSLKMPKISADVLQKKLRVNEKRTLRIAELTGRIDEMESQIVALNEDLQKLKNLISRTKRNRMLLSVIDKTRQVFHRDRLATRVAMTNLHAVLKNINETLLEQFGSPFWVELDDSLQFVVRRPGYLPHPASRLSAGQKVVLAIAFWLAVSSLWKSDTGLLALDEPTASLDASNKQHLSDALAKLAITLKGKRQVIMVTHADELKPSFAQIIELE